MSEHLVGLIAKQVEERSFVVWYDPGADYRAVAERLEIPGTTIARYDGSFLKLRREIDPLLNDLEPPKLVVYVPVEQASTYHALVELEKAGVDGPHVRLRELVTDAEFTCHNASGYRGRPGELWYVRLLPPLLPDLARYYIAFTTPYILTRQSGAPPTSNREQSPLPPAAPS